MKATTEGLSAFQKETSEGLSRWNRTADGNEKKKNAALDAVAERFVIEMTRHRMIREVEEAFDSVCDRLGFMTEYTRLMIMKRIVRKMHAMIPVSEEEEISS